MTKPLFSIVIAAYNRAHFVEQAIESVFKQTFREFEIIVVDDGSTDETHEVLSRFENRIRVVRQSRNGRSSARNTGARLARGAFIAFLDSDDIWMPQKLERQFRVFQSHSRVGVVHTYSNVINTEGSSLANETRKRQRLYERALKRRYTYEGMSQECIMFLSTVAVRRRCWELIGPMDTNIPAFEDWDWYLRAAMVTEIATISEPLVLYRVHADNTPESEFITGRIATSLKHLALLENNTTLRTPKRARRNFYIHLAAANYMQGRSTQAGQWMRRALALDPKTLFSPRYFRYVLSMVLPQQILNNMRRADKFADRVS